MRTGRPPLVLPAAQEMGMDARVMLEDAQLALEMALRDVLAARVALARQARALERLAERRQQHETGAPADGRPPG